MMRRFLHAKIRDIRITETLLEYEGSVALDSEYLDRAGIAGNEEVHVLNLENGSRITTYAIAAPAGSGTVQLNGPAARCGLPGDRIMVLSYCLLSADEIAGHSPRVVRVNPS